MERPQVDPERLKELKKYQLKRGGHRDVEAGMCAMEAVAWLAHEPHSDRPACASPVIAAFVRRWNDDLDDEGRQKLKPYLPRLIGSRASPEVERARGWLAADWAVRHSTPAWLELAGLKEQADALRALPEIKDRAGGLAARDLCDAAKHKAWEVWEKFKKKAAAAAAAAAYAAYAAYAAAYAAAAADAAYAAAYAAAAAAYAAAYAAADKKRLEPTKVSLQKSAFDLLDRMLALQ